MSSRGYKNGYTTCVVTHTLGGPRYVPVSYGTVLSQSSAGMYKGPRSRNERLVPSALASQGRLPRDRPLKEEQVLRGMAWGQGAPGRGAMPSEDPTEAAVVGAPRTTR